MKKSFLLFAAIAMSVSFSTAVMAQVSETNSANAQIITAITLSKINPLEFGKIATGLGAAGGTVVLSTGSEATATTVGLVAGTTRTAASYTIAGEASRQYTLTLPTDVVITSTAEGSPTMHVTAFTAKCGSAANGVTHALPSSGTEAIYVGGTLTIANNQVAGAYTGTFPVTVVYN